MSFRLISRNEENPIETSYIVDYKIHIETPETSLAKTYETKNEIIITLKVPKSDYNNINIQRLLEWAKIPVYEKNYYRDLAVHLKIEEVNERSIVFTHAKMTYETKTDVKSDYVTIILTVNQKLDRLSGVAFGIELEETYERAIKKANNPPLLNIYDDSEYSNNSNEALYIQDLNGQKNVDKYKNMVYVWLNGIKYVGIIKDDSAMVDYNAAIKYLKELGYKVTFDNKNNKIYIDSNKTPLVVADGNIYVRELAQLSGMIDKLSTKFDNSGKHIILEGKDTQLTDVVTVWVNGKEFKGKYDSKTKKTLIGIDICEAICEVLEYFVIMSKDKTKLTLLIPDININVHHRKEFNAADGLIEIRELAKYLEIEYLLSNWNDDKGLNVMLNSAMKDGPYHFQRINEKVDVKIYVTYNKDGSDICLNSSKTYKEIIREAVQEFWGNGFEYENTIFDRFGENIIFNIDVIEGTMLKTAIINVYNKSEVEVDENGIVTETQICNVSVGNWAIDYIGKMSIYNFWAKKGRTSFSTYTVTELKNTIAHEFGHFLGLGDAYGYDPNNGHIAADDTYEVPNIDFYYGSAMRYNGHANANDIEMLIEAVKKNKWQYFHDCSVHKKSDVLKL